MNQKSFRLLIIGMNQFVLVLTMRIDNSDSTLDLANCIVNAAQLVSERKVALEYNHDHYNLVTQVLKTINIPVVLNIVETRKPTGIEVRLFSDLVLVFKEEPKEILKKTLWNGDTRFLIITTEQEKMEKFFEYFWTFKVINVFAVLSNESDISLHSFLPYKSKNCTALQLVLVDSCVEGKLVRKAQALKDTMRIKNMNGCRMNITVTDVRPNVIFESVKGRNSSSSIKGFEGKLMAEVSKAYNSKVTFKLPDDGIGWGWIHPSPHGTVSEVYLGISDVAIGMLGALPDRYESLDVSKSYNVDECVTFGVPQGYAVKKSSWKTIFLLEFNILTWALIIFSFTLISIAMWLFNKLLNLNWFSSSMETVILVFSSCLGIPISTPDYASVKTLVAFWVIVTFVISVAYKGSMGSKLAVPPRDGDLQTFEDLLQSDLKLNGYKNMQQVLNISGDRIFKKLFERYIFVNYSIEYVVDRIAERDKLAHLRHKSTFQYFALINPKARGRIHMLKDCVFTYHPVVITKKYSPFTNRISEIISNLEEAGIMKMWRDNYLWSVPPPTKPFVKLSIRQMYGIFYFILIGHVTAFISFLLELFVKFFYSKNLRNSKNYSAPK